MTVMFIPDPGGDLRSRIRTLPIPDPGRKKYRVLGSGSRIRIRTRNTVIIVMICLPLRNNFLKISSGCFALEIA
jgi:hypothetical protein